MLSPLLLGNRKLFVLTPPLMQFSNIANLKIGGLGAASRCPQAVFEGFLCKIHRLTPVFGLV